MPALWVHRVLPEGSTYRVAPLFPFLGTAHLPILFFDNTKLYESTRKHINQIRVICTHFTELRVSLSLPALRPASLLQQCVSGGVVTRTRRVECRDTDSPLPSSTPSPKEPLRERLIYKMRMCPYQGAHPHHYNQ